MHQYLPNDILHELVLLSSDFLTIISLCISSKSLHNICHNNNFWLRKLRQDFQNFPIDTTNFITYRTLSYIQNILIKMKNSVEIAYDTSNLVLIYETNDQIHDMNDIAIVKKYIANMTRFKTLHPALYVIGCGPYDNFYISYNIGIDNSMITDNGHIITIINYMSVMRINILTNLDLMKFLYDLSQVNIRFDLVMRKDVKYKRVCFDK